MGIIDFFKKKKVSNEYNESLNDLTLSNLKVGYLVDYDMKTWEVTAYHYYDWNGDISYEWQLKCGDDVAYLEMESDDNLLWSLYHTISFMKLGSKVKEHILAKGDPPEEIVYQGRTYSLEVTSGGHFYKDGRGPKQELLSWTFEDEQGENFLDIEQWGETDFEASIGIPVEEYQFTNILPGNKK